MAEQDLQPQPTAAERLTVGARLRRAREAQGLSRADIAARTKIAERHLAAIEEERYADLASSTYAVGFSRAYARAVGLDEREIAQAMRGELDTSDEPSTPAKPTFEPGDPARVPSLRTAWVAGIAAIAVIGGVIVFWGSYIFPAVSLPDLIKPAPPPASTPRQVAPAPPPPGPTAQDPVVITATQPNVWVKITDKAGKRLLEKQLALGESFTVPADAVEPRLRTGWPDALAVTIGGKPVAPLADKRVVVTAPVSAAALLARNAPAPVQAPAAQPTAAPPPATAPVPTPPPAAKAPTPPPAPAVQSKANPPRTVRPTTPAPRPNAATRSGPAATPSLTPENLLPAEQPKASPASE